MKITPVNIRSAKIGACLCLAALANTEHTLAQTVNIAPMTWTGSGRTDWIDVQTCGALGDGSTNDTAAIQSALNLASTSTTQMTVYFPTGTYLINDTLSWNTGTYGISGRSMIGCGSDTTIAWSGTSGRTMFQSAGNSKARYIGIRWDGRNLAATAMLFDPQNSGTSGMAEAPIRHFNEAFVNFTGVALNFSNTSATDWTGEVSVWNCLFYKCHYGSQIGINFANDYEYLFEGCEFENCDTGIDSSGNTAQMVYNTHFSNSTVTDLHSNLAVRVRHCTSAGSKAFFTSTTWSGGGGNDVFQDCWIDSWTNVATGTNSGAIQIGDRSKSVIFDCRFTHPPSGAATKPPINLTDPGYHPGSSNIMLCNNSFPGIATQSGMVQVTGTGPTNILSINAAPVNPNVGITTMVSSASYVFLNSTAINDSANILDVTQAPYYASRDFNIDATSAIQHAINDAKTNGNGSIVYIPVGFYSISSPLDVSGSNYSIEGGGYWSHLCWTGTDGGTVLSVTTPQNIAISDIVVKTLDITPDTATLTESASGSASLFVDNFYHRQYSSTGTYTVTNYVGNVPGIVLDSLPASCLSYFGFMNDDLAVHDCGSAVILGNQMDIIGFDIDGTNNAKSGFLGIMYGNTGIMWTVSATDTGVYDINVLDNQDLAMGDYYNEQTYSNLNMQSGTTATWTGRVSIQGFKRDAWQNDTAINIDNYRGRLFYGPQTFDNAKKTAASKIVQSGTGPIDLILPLDTFWAATPVISTTTSCHLIQQYNVWTTTTGDQTAIANTPATLTIADDSSIGAGLDHLRQLGLKELAVVQGYPVPAPQWSDTFASVTGTGSDVLSFSGTAGSYFTGTLHPTGDSNSYIFYYKGNSVFTVSLTGTQNTVGTEPGLKFANNTGAAISTSYGGYNSSDINIALLMGWTPGSVTTTEVSSLVLTFDYVSAGFPSNPLGVGLAASSTTGPLTLKGSFSSAGSLTHATFAMNTQTGTNVQNFTNNLNANGGVLTVAVVVPGGVANTGASLGIANLLLQSR